MGPLKRIQKTKKEPESTKVDQKVQEGPNYDKRGIKRIKVDTNLSKVPRIVNVSKNCK